MFENELLREVGLFAPEENKESEPFPILYNE
jgi:hypothetical protein